VPISAGILSNLAARKDKFFYISTPQEARQFGTPERGPRNVLHVYDLTKREDKVLLEGIDGYDLDKEGKKVIYKAGPVYGIVEAAPGKAKVGEGKLNLSELQVEDRSARRVARSVPRSLARRARFLLGPQHDRP